MSRRVTAARLADHNWSNTVRLRSTIGPMGDLAPAGTWTAGLDAEQRAAVQYEGAALLIVAGAGTGKTRTLVARLARLVEAGVAPDRLLLVTFSRRAADELVRRLGHLVGADAGRRVHAGTFHAIAHRLLRQHGARLGLAGGFSVLDPGDAADLMQLARQAVTAGEGEVTRRRLPRKDTLLDIYSRVVNARQPLAEVLPRAFPWVQEHEALIARSSMSTPPANAGRALLDFDDLLLYWRAAAGRRDPRTGPGRRLRPRLRRRVPGHQPDPGRHRPAAAAGRPGGDRRGRRRPGHLCLPGGHRAQHARVPRPVPRRRRSSPSSATTAPPSRSSTWPTPCSPTPLRASPSACGRRSAGGPRPALATCPDVGAQAAAVADVILEHHETGVALRQQAVLFRSAHHSDLLEVELRRRRIPFVKYGGLRFLEAAHVRDLLAALRVLDNPRDELAWYRLLQLVDGIGPVTARQRPGVARTRSTRLRPAGPLRQPGPPAAGEVAATPWLRLQQALADCRPDTVPPAVQIDRLRAAPRAAAARVATPTPRCACGIWTP